MEKFYEYENYFKCFQTKQKISKNISDEWVEKVIEMYNYSKSILTEDNSYIINQMITNCEIRFPYKYILDVKCKSKLDTSFSYLYKTLDNFSSKEDVLDFISSTTRNNLYESYKLRLKIPHEKFFDSFDTNGYCYESSLEVIKVCNKLGIKNKLIEISPGFDDSLKLMDGYGHHYVALVELEKECFLVDCTYKQFFDAAYCLLEIMGMYKGNSLPWLGIYMMMDQNRKKLSKKLLSDGWIKLDEKSMKDYFDGFVLGYRNALYYEDLGCLNFDVNYTANDYESFILGDDSQANHENPDYLGTQKIFIKNPKIEFKTDLSLLKH